jgi:hypothetical protein
VLTMVDDILTDGLVVRAEATQAGEPLIVNQLAFDAVECELKSTRLRCEDVETGSRVTFKHKSASDPFSIRMDVLSQTFIEPTLADMPAAVSFQTPTNYLDRRATLETCREQKSGFLCQL